MKYVLVIGDGMADDPAEILGGLTALEKANIPNMDRLAQEGILGSVRNCPEGLPAGSDTAIYQFLAATPVSITQAERRLKRQHRELS